MALVSSLLVHPDKLLLNCCSFENLGFRDKIAQNMGYSRNRYKNRTKANWVRRGG